MLLFKNGINGGYILQHCSDFSTLIVASKYILFPIYRRYTICIGFVVRNLV